MIIQVIVRILLLALVFSIIECWLLREDDFGYKTYNFDSPEEYLDNPSLISAVEECSFPINYGSSPPNLEGLYSLSGQVVNASNPSMIGTPMGSTIELDNQFGDNIDEKETLGGNTVFATESFGIGNYGNFTIFQESEQDNPYGSGYACIVFLMSGQRLFNGDLYIETLTVITEVVDWPGAVAGGWYAGEVFLTSNPNGGTLESLAKDRGIGLAIDAIIML